MTEIPNQDAMKLIVVGIDFSPESVVALEQAIAIARRPGARVLMVHVTGGGGDVDSASIRQLIEEQRAAVREQLGELRERYGGQGVEVSHALIDGFADIGLCKAADDLGADLTVVGTHGRAGLKRFFLGSVAEKVVRLSAGDVLVARPGQAAGGFERILVPTDFSPAADHALERACELAAADASIDIVHYWQLPMPITHPQAPISQHRDTIKQIGRTVEAEAHERAKPLLEKSRRRGHEVSFDTRIGSPAHAIVDRAAGYDLIAMGSHGHRGFKRFLLGSVAEQTVRHAPCTVFVTHAGATEAE